MATMPGREDVLEKTLYSLVDQFDVVRVYCNNMTTPPVDVDFDNVEWIFGEHDLTDNGKFYALDHITQPEWFATVDDDIIYPADYADRMFDAVKKYHCIVTIHGRRLLGLDLNYYRGHKHVHCAHRHDKHQWVDIPGSGVMCMDTRYFHPRWLAHHELGRMSDVLVGHAAAMSGRRILAIAKRDQWVKPQHVPVSIWSEESRKPNLEQIKLCNEIWHEKTKSK